MASRMVQVKVTLPQDQFLQLERLRKQMNLSRSALIAQAIQHLIASTAGLRRGSPEALLPHAGTWVLAPGELEALLQDIEQMREMGQ